MEPIMCVRCDEEKDCCHHCDRCKDCGCHCDVAYLDYLLEHDGLIPIDVLKEKMLPRFRKFLETHGDSMLPFRDLHTREIDTLLCHFCQLAGVNYLKIPLPEPIKKG